MEVHYLTNGLEIKRTAGKEPHVGEKSQATRIGHQQTLSEHGIGLL